MPTKIRRPGAAAICYGRLTNGYTQEQLAELMREATGDEGWTTSRVIRAENDRYELRGGDVFTMSRILGVRLPFLTAGEGALVSLSPRSGPDPTDVTLPNVRRLPRHHPITALTSANTPPARLAA